VIDHVTVRVSDYGRSSAFYDAALAPLGLERGWSDDALRLAEWGDFSIAQDGNPVTRHAHVALRAPSREAVKGFHAAAIAAGARDNGPPGERPHYGPDYYAAYVFDPDGTNLEAVVREPRSTVDHVTLHVRSVDAAAAFFAAIAPAVGWAPGASGADFASFRGTGASLWLIEEDELTENLHLAFGARDRATVDRFHEAALRRGGRDNGAPGERAVYHPGYYGAYALDPDGNNVEAVFHDRG
jgi:catechol 2,3-dioxygenase-like lactoylglutathione lyase family enzyme